MASGYRIYEKDLHSRKHDNSQMRVRNNNSLPKKKFDEFSQNKKNTIGHGPLNKKENQMPVSQRQINPYNYGVPSNNININVNNLIINNNQNPNFCPYPNNFGVYLSNSSVFSKLGSDIIGKASNSKAKKRPQPNNHNSVQVNYSPNTKNVFGINKSEPNVEKVIANLIEVTKDKPDNLIEVPQIQQERIIPDQIQEEQEEDKETHLIPTGESQINCTDEMLSFNAVIWYTLIDLELNVDSRQHLTISIKKCLLFITEHIPFNMNKQNTNIISFDIFSSPSLNSAYNKLIKIAFVLLIYLKFILLDFNYEMTLKSNVKKISNSLNIYLLAILEKCVFVNNDKDSTEKTLNKMSSEFIEHFNKIGKIHHTKKTKENMNQFGSSMCKNLEMAINHIKQMSNNYFKIGYFKFIHNICFEFFRLIDNYSSVEIAQLTINYVLFFVIHNNPQERNREQSISNQQILFNPTTLLGLCGFGNNVSSPFLPPVKENVYTLVLDLDDTLTPSGGTFLIRPGCFEFLAEMSQCSEIVVFTAAMKDYADSIINLIDPENKFIKYRLYRHHTSISGVSFVKDLTKLGRDLGKVLIIDNIKENFKLQPNNGLEIKTWSEEIRDNQLKDIQIMLKALYSKQPSDIRVILKKIKVEVTKRIKRNVISPYANIDIEKYILP